jgi:sterol desaturase/sphingolipid hydroxylase (fatty acid hydroxylase superfamily)
MKKQALFLAGLLAASLCGYVVGVYVLSVIVSHFPAVGPFVFVQSHGSTKFTLTGAAMQPAAFMAAVAFCLAFDVACLGLEKSSLKRLLDLSSPSARVDLFYMVLRLAGGFNVLVFIFSFGTLFWLVNQVHRVLHIGILENLHSFVMQLAIVFMINTFVGYWAHRLMHTRWLWELHKVHHAAEEMNIITPFRNHPIEQVLMSLVNAVPVALLGATPSVIITFSALNMVYQSLAHSELNLKSRIWDWIWITPAAHRIHHSDKVEHFDRNFGTLTLWDYIFGTYLLPTNEQLSYGVDDGETFNRPQYVREVFDNVRRWLGEMTHRPPVVVEKKPQILPAVSTPKKAA